VLVGSSTDPRSSALAKIQQAFEKAGVVFTDDGGIVPPPE